MAMKLEKFNYINMKGATNGRETLLMLAELIKKSAQVAVFFFLIYTLFMLFLFPLTVAIIINTLIFLVILYLLLSIRHYLIRCFTQYNGISITITELHNAYCILYASIAITLFCGLSIYSAIQEGSTVSDVSKGVFGIFGVLGAYFCLLLMVILKVAKKNYADYLDEYARLS